MAPHVGGHLEQPLDPLGVLSDVREVEETVRHWQQVLLPRKAQKREFGQLFIQVLSLNTLHFELEEHCHVG